MCGNRVEELESRVQELEASVEGLTDELVECKVRIRELENAIDEDLGFVPPAEEETEESADEDEQEIRIPEVGESTAEADRSNTEGQDTEDTTEDSETEIIVA